MDLFKQTERRSPGLAREVSSIVHTAGLRLDTAADLDPLIERIGSARYVLLGEASHGTAEYYLWRARLSRRLIEEKGFSFIAVEGDWPDCYQVNRYIKGYPEAGKSPFDALAAFQRWPAWMWANWEVAALVEWLRRYNAGRSEPAGFYGLDVYSLWESLESVLTYLEGSHPEAVQAAQAAFRCFEPYGADEQAYAWSTRMTPETCEDEVIDLLRSLRSQPKTYATDQEAAFSAEQNALVTVNAERYYRAMVRSNVSSWNLRDRHMAETLDRLMAHHRPDSRAIVWAHNTHIGDARYTDMAADGLLSLGQVVREEHAGEGVFLVGFGAYQGSVIAGRSWGAPPQLLEVPAAASGSWEALLHEAWAGQVNSSGLLLFSEHLAGPAFQERRGHRAVGVVYNPEQERLGNYVPTSLPGRYDAFIFFDQTQALHPLPARLDPAAAPDTYPWGF